MTVTKAEWRGFSMLMSEYSLDGRICNLIFNGDEMKLNSECINSLQLLPTPDI